MLYSVSILYFLSITAIVNYFFLKWTRPLCFKYRHVDKPGTRKIHSTAIPLSGGIGVFASMAAVILLHIMIFVPLKPLFMSIDEIRIHSELFSMRTAYLRMFFIVFATGTIWLAGFYDDRHKNQEAAFLKLVTQIIVALLTVFGAGVKLSFFSSEIANSILSFLWIVGIMNSFNLLDNMDGLTAGIAVIALSILSAVATLQGQFLVSILLATVIGSLLGFLPHNFSKKKIFLGDSGSHSIGYIIAVITLLESYVSQSTNSLFPLFIPIIVLALPLCDTFYVIYYRLKTKRPIWVGDNNHLSHRLVQSGFTQRQAVAILCLVSLTLSLSALLLLITPTTYSIVILTQCAIVITLMFTMINIARRNRQWTNTFAEAHRRLRKTKVTLTRGSASESIETYVDNLSTSAQVEEASPDTNETDAPPTDIAS